MGASLVAQLVKNLPVMQETQVRFLVWEDPMEKEMAAHSSINAWRIPWTEEPGRLLSMGSQGSDTTQRLGLPSCARGAEPACQCRRRETHGFQPGSGRSPGGGHGNPLKYFCLENPTDRGAWWATSPQGRNESDTIEAT